jgi:hypothetical protein
MLFILVLALLPLVAAGCGGSEKDKGSNRTKDMPRAEKTG